MLRTVNLGYCEFCLKNAHQKVKMKFEKISQCEWERIMLVCPECGSTRC